MVFTLISPSGTRVLLFENRGGATTNGLGGTVLRTNIFPTRTAGDYMANTNILHVGTNQGTLFVSYDMYTEPDTMHVYYDNVLIYDSGLVSYSNHVAIPFGPGVSTNIVIIMNEGNNRRHQHTLGIHRHRRLPGPGLRGVHREHQPGPGPHQVCLAAVPARRHEPGPLLPARTIAQHPRRRECLRHLATGNVGHPRRGRRSRARIGRLAIAFRLPEYRPRADWLELRGHCHQHHSARLGRPLCH